jgi:hypothetical protein
MTSVVDFLERMGSEAQWRYASSEDIDTALADAQIDAAMRAAILARSAEEVQALLAQARVMCTNQTPAPTPYEEPRPPQPAPGKEEEEEDDNTKNSSKPSNSTSGSLSSSSHSSQ